MGHYFTSAPSKGATAEIQIANGKTSNATYIYMYGRAPLTLTAAYMQPGGVRISEVSGVFLVGVGLGPELVELSVSKVGGLVPRPRPAFRRLQHGKGTRLQSWYESENVTTPLCHCVVKY